MNTIRYTRCCVRGSTKLVQSLCQSSPGRARSKNRIAFFRRGEGPGVAGSPAAATLFRTLPTDTFSPPNRPRNDRTRFNPKCGNARFTATIRSVTPVDSGARPRRPPRRGVSSPRAPSCSYRSAQPLRIRGLTFHTFAKSCSVIPDF
jgi:hypothetical protein